MRNKDILEKRNAKIRAEYAAAKAKKKHTPEFIQQKLSDKYFLAVATIQKILYE